MQIHVSVFIFCVFSRKCVFNSSTNVKHRNCVTIFLCRGSTAEEATQNIISFQIPALIKLCQSGELSIDNIDVFCEKGVFDTDTSRRILEAGKEAGWKINFHGDEINSMNSGEVSVDLCGSFCGVVVSTCASHAQGPRFNPGQKLFLYFV